MDSNSILIAAGILYFAACGLYFYNRLTKKNDHRFQKSNFFFVSKMAHLGNRIKLWVTSLIPKVNFLNNNRTLLGTLLELGIIALWALWVGQAYLNFDPLAIPNGREYFTQIQQHHTWTRALQCGWCAIWNGNEAGGYPMLGIPFSSAFHPIVILTTLLWGVTTGAKIAMIIALWFAGLAQWWLAYELKLGKIARIWTACLAVAAGHITGKMESGFFTGIIGIAMFSLLFASMIAVYHEKGKKFIALLGVVGASAILSGGGYLQACFLGVTPSLLVLLVSRNGKIKKIWRDFLLGLVIACLLAAPLLIPMLNFMPNFAKNTSPDFETAQSIKYMPLNLVIDDWVYYQSDGILNKGPFPSLYIMYIGWIPVILAIMGLFVHKRDQRPIVWYILLTVLQIFLFASATSLKWVVDIIPAVANIRFSSVVSGLAVPLILGLTAYGIEYLLTIEWPTLHLQYQAEEFSFSTRWLLVIPFLISLSSVYQFSKFSIYTHPLEPDVISTITALKTADSQWVNTPFGEQYFIEPAVAMGLKISPGFQMWVWKDKQTPQPSLMASRVGPPAETYQKISSVSGLEIYQNPDLSYASIQIGDEVIPCAAQSTGGLIKVNCDSTTAGTLVVQENYIRGWQVQMDDQPATIMVKDSWLAANAPAGKHTFTFQYLPWDVPLGILLAIVGLIVTIRVWKSGAESKSTLNMPQ